MDAILFHPETSMRRALIRAWGQSWREEETLGTETGSPLIENPLALYQKRSRRRHPWGGGMDLAESGGSRELLKKKMRRCEEKEPGEHRWYVNGQGQTFAVIDGPIEFDMGSPPTDLECFDFDDEPLHKRVNSSAALPSPSRKSQC